MCGWGGGGACGFKRREKISICSIKNTPIKVYFCCSLLIISLFLSQSAMAWNCTIFHAEQTDETGTRFNFGVICLTILREYHYSCGSWMLRPLYTTNNVQNGRFTFFHISLTIVAVLWEHVWHPYRWEFLWHICSNSDHTQMVQIFLLKKEQSTWLCQGSVREMGGVHICIPYLVRKISHNRHPCLVRNNP